jgi:spore coat polysaccharide biosynthesis predicted glycosyltransferase SpsG
MPRQIDSDWAWMPLTYAREKTITGGKYLIIDPILDDIGKKCIERGNILVTCGGADPFKLTEQILSIVPASKLNGVVIGPNFNRNVFVPSEWVVYNAPSFDEMRTIMASYKKIICAWGTSVFESSCLNKVVIQFRCITIMSMKQDFSICHLWLRIIWIKLLNCQKVK